MTSPDANHPPDGQAVETTGLVTKENSEFVMSTTEAAVILAKGFVGVGWLAVGFGVKEVCPNNQSSPLPDDILISYSTHADSSHRRDNRGMHHLVVHMHGDVRSVGHLP